jgi:ring-1,2-phenylacetyl-CoA epoxidase subunit PaaC
MSESDAVLFQYLLRLGDEALILGHRLSEWCGHGPILEEDLALGNIGLDLLGHAQAFLSLAGRVENRGRDENRLAYFRDEREFLNVQLVELPRGDFAFTIARQFFFDTYAVNLFEQLQKCTHLELAGLAAKFLKEHAYHWRHSSQWVIRLGDGTEESRRRLLVAIEELWPYTGELFNADADAVDGQMLKQFGAPRLDQVRTAWHERINLVFQEATIPVPTECWMQSGGRKGLHTESLGKLLAEMQILTPSHPDAVW